MGLLTSWVDVNCKKVRRKKHLLSCLEESGSYAGSITYVPFSQEAFAGGNIDDVPLNQEAAMEDDEKLHPWNV